MSVKLTKKGRKYYSKLLTEKLKAMGVKDEISFTPSGKKRKTLKFDENGSLVLKDGKPEVIEVDMPIAQNILRRTVKSLRKQELSVIEAFLNIEIPVATEEDGKA